MNVPTPQPCATVRTFAQRLSSTRRGARLARLLAMERLTAWELSPGVVERAEHVIAELAVNAAQHGRVQGRDFLLALTLDEAAGILRIAVSDTRGEYRPAIRPDRGPDDESGRGLLLVDALADRWGTEPRPPSGKTVWAEIDQHDELQEAVPRNALTGRPAFPFPFRTDRMGDLDIPDLGGPVLDDGEIQATLRGRGGYMGERADD
ncbi:ATP-binding protein [Streptomyces sp. NPDC005423]|uniref:ATP-binding protein n=1 Tax=Streptomyces sp. NPDC005423 TaxID=3155343 RepID=UPI0033A4DF78